MSQSLTAGPYSNRSRSRAIAMAMLAFLVLAALTGQTQAHSFNTALIIPGAATAEQERGMIEAFLIASEETDSHAGQESDGHLGGLDVYLTPLRGAAWDRIAEAAPDFIILDDATDASGAAAGMPAVVVRPLAPGAGQAQRLLATPANPEFADFEERFKERMSRSAGRFARATYVAARRIGAAVGAANGAGDRAALQRLLGGE